jgi:FKBP-type peptidyl-prolyl cis-trans isomerase SlyD
MKIEKNKVVSMTYSLSSDSGQVLELRSIDNPVEFLVGHGQILPSLEKRILGESEGFSGRFLLQPEEAHGEYKKELVKEIKSSQFPPDINLKKGMKFESTDANGEPLALHVLDVKGDIVLVDGNHPLAGISLSFDLKIVEIRDAAEEEIFQGRVLTDLEPASDTKH